jgi:hypothetical protein
MTTYYNRFNPAKNYEKHRFMDSRPVQAPELNEIQEEALYRAKLLGDALFKDGQVVSGCECAIVGSTAVVTAGELYINGAVRAGPAASLPISLAAHYNIGLYISEHVVTYLEDPTLRDPVVGSRAYNEPGADRLQLTFTWAALITGDAPNATQGDFYPIFEVDQGKLITSSASNTSGVSAEADAVNTALARYDKDSNGSYVVKGLALKYQETTETEQTFILSEGKAHVDGYEVEIPYSSRLFYEIDPDLSTISSEPHTFTPGDQGWMTIALDSKPVASIQVVDILQQKTVTLTHGAFTGVSDTIPDSAIQEIVHAAQGGIVYVQNTDFKLTAGAVDWSLPGDEPAPGSTYEVTYRARTHVTPQNVTESGFDIQNAVPSSMVLVDYKWKMPRYDLVTIGKDAKVSKIRGISHQYRPAIPKAPTEQLALAYIYQTWASTQDPIVTSTITQAISMSDLQAMKKAIGDLYDFVAEERLKNDANARDPAAKKGLLVDPFFDDDMRDQGVAQTAAIVDQSLQLPIAATVVDAAAEGSPWLLPYDLTPIVSQTSRTSNMKINPYQAFDPLPAEIQLTPATDRWTLTDSIWTSDTTGRYSTTSSPVIEQAIGADSLSGTTAQNGVLRPLTVTATIKYMEPGETIVQAYFDGLEVELIAIGE